MTEQLQNPKYTTDVDGYVDWVSVSSGEFQQSMYITSPYILGRKTDGHPPLGLGLRVKGDERDFPHAASMHIEDIPEFTKRVTVFRQLRDGFKRDQEDALVPLTQEDIDNSIEFLGSFGIDRAEVIDTTLTNRQSTLNYQVLGVSWLLGKELAE